jgi:glycolate oxidase FAD binding subunit
MPIPPELAHACADIALASGDDVIGGRQARYVAALRAELGGLGDAENAARAVVVYAPDEVRDLTDAHGPVPSLALIRAVKYEFDPQHRMAPGRIADAV